MWNAVGCCVAMPRRHAMRSKYRNKYALKWLVLGTDILFLSVSMSKSTKSNTVFSIPKRVCGNCSCRLSHNNNKSNGIRFFTIKIERGKNDPISLSPRFDQSGYCWRNILMSLSSLEHNWLNGAGRACRRKPNAGAICVPIARITKELYFSMKKNERELNEEEMEILDNICMSQCITILCFIFFSSSEVSGWRCVAYTHVTIVIVTFSSIYFSHFLHWRTRRATERNSIQTLSAIRMR